MAHPSSGNTTSRSSIRVLVLGFMVGFTFTCFIRLARRSSAQLNQLNDYYEMASGAMPYIQSALGDAVTNDPPKNQTSVSTGGVKREISSNQTQSPVASVRTSHPKVHDKTFVPPVHPATNSNHNSPKEGPPVLQSKVVKEFERQEGVVIATKIHSTNHIAAIAQSLCLLHYAYNNRVLYDVIVFSTHDISESELAPVRELIKPAKLIFVVDNEGLHERIDSLEPAKKTALLKRCNVTDTKDVEWYTWCDVDDTGQWERLAYTWQAEFRSLHVWTHSALKPYKYMLWFDSDAFCTKVWPRDPVAFMIQNDLAIFFDHFPAGRSRGEVFNERFVTAFNTTLCFIKLVNGRLVPTLGGHCPKPAVPQIHGFFHITNLDFYRSDPVMHWSRTLIGDTIFSRKFDDQIGVTAPAAVLAPERSWEMRQNGVRLDVFHNGLLDGQQWLLGSYKRWFSINGTKIFPEAAGKCPITNGQ